MKLIYHNNESAEGGLSPFDKVIIELAKNRNICIVCPYIGLEYFRRIIKYASIWYLVTDIKAWLISHNPEAREEIKNFIAENISNIHYYKDVHAKVIVTDNAVFIGSANLTEKGITGRVEMSVLIEEKEQIDEVQKWFWDLWNKTKPVSCSELEKCTYSIMSLPSPDLYKQEYSLPSYAPAIKAKLTLIESENINIENIVRNNQKSHERLIECIKLMLNRDWINEYFDLAKEMIEFIGLTSDDPRLVMSITGKREIPISINQRYVLMPYYNGNVGLIMPLEYDSQNYDTDGVVFDDENYFFTNKIKKARWLGFERKNKIEFSERIKNYWKQAAMAELKRGKISGRRGHHNPVVYEAVMNLSYRNKLLEEAFSKII